VPEPEAKIAIRFFLIDPQGILLIQDNSKICFFHKYL